MNTTFSVKNFEQFQHYKDRSPPWIKLYNELLDDYEFGLLPDASKLHLILIWLLASRSANKLPFDEAWIARRINASETVNLCLLAKHGFIIVDGEIHKQNQTLNNTEQVASKLLHTLEQGARPEREGEGETETEQRQREIAPPAPAADAAPESDDDLLPVFADRRPEGKAAKAWNEAAERLGLPTIQRLTRPREAALRQRLAEVGGLEGWSVALAKVEASSFLNGTAPRSAKHQNWRCTFDFIVKAENFTKLMEGNFDDGDQQGPTNGFAAIVTEDQLSAGAGDGRPGELHPD